jgi:hypothetical protein
MKKNISFFIVLVLLNSLFITGSYENLFAAEQTKQTPAQAAEYLKLRLDYSKTAEYNPYDSEVSEIRKECYKLMDAGKYKEAIEKAESGLKKDKYNIFLTIALSAAYRKNQDTENADRYRKLWVGLVSSILTSGDGKSAGTAFKVISVDEEYAVLAVLDLIRTKQRLVNIENSNYDVLQVKNEQTGKEFELYFNVDIPFSWLLEKNKAKN